MVFREIIVNNVGGESVVIESMGKVWKGSEVRIESSGGRLLMFLIEENGGVVEMWEIGRNVLVKMVSRKEDWVWGEDRWIGGRGL